MYLLYTWEQRSCVAGGLVDTKQIVDYGMHNVLCINWFLNTIDTPAT